MKLSLELTKGGDMKPHNKYVYDDALYILHKCGTLVRFDDSLEIMMKEHAILKLYHAQCHIMLNQLNIGDYYNG